MLTFHIDRLNCCILLSEIILIDRYLHIDVTRYEHLYLFLIILASLCVNLEDLTSLIRKWLLFVIQKIEELNFVTLFIIIIY